MSAGLAACAAALRRGADIAGELLVEQLAEAMMAPRSDAPWPARFDELLATVATWRPVLDDAEVAEREVRDDADIAELGDIGEVLDDAEFGEVGGEIQESGPQVPSREPAIDVAVGRLLYPGRHRRPVTRAECLEFERPCPFVGCRHHLFIDVTPSGSITPLLESEPWDIPASCSLDVADAGGATLEQIGAYLNVSSQRVRQIEQKALRKLKRQGLAISAFEALHG